MFAVGFDFARVVLPVDGFYEWRTSNDVVKIPHFLYHADGERLTLAAIASSWHDPTKPDAYPVLTVAIVGGHLELPAGGQWVPNDGHYGMWWTERKVLRRRCARTRRSRAASVDLGVVAELPGPRAQGQPTFKP